MGDAMATKKAPDNVHPETGEILDGTFGDEDQDLTRFDDPTQVPRMKKAFSREQLQALAEADDPLAVLAQLAAERGTEIVDAVDALSDGSKVVTKASLVGREFYVIDWKFCASTRFNSTFSAVQCMDMNMAPNAPGRMFVFTDGGIGIHQALVQYYMKEGQTIPLHCAYGLSKSTYNTEDAAGNPIEGTTYWVANSPPK